MIDLDIGGGEKVTVTPPEREDFSDNLGGAIAFVFTSFLYKVLEFSGDALGTFIGGIVVRLLERLEPHAIEYVSPVLDELLTYENIPAGIREFLERLRNPEHEVGMTLATGFATQFSGAVTSSVLGVLLRDLTYEINELNPTQLPDVNAIIAMDRRGLYNAEEIERGHKYLGYNNSIYESLKEISRPRLGVNDLMIAYIRGNISPEKFYNELRAFGFIDEDIEALLNNAYRRLEVDTLVKATFRGEITENDYTREMEELGYSRENANTILAINKRLLPINDAITAFYRGEIDERDLNRILQQNGIEDGDIPIIKAISRPLLSPPDISRAYYRGLITREEYVEGLKSHGYKEEDIEKIIEILKPIPGPSDQVRFALREAFREDIVAKYQYDEDRPSYFDEIMAKLGFDSEWAQYYWRAHWELPSISMGFDMLHRGVIDRETLVELLKIQDIAPYWRDKLLSISYHPLTRVDVRRMYGLGVLDREGVKRAYLDLGYNDENAERMTEFTIKYEEDDGSSNNQQIRTKTLSLIETAFKLDLYSEDDVRTSMRDLGYTDDLIDTYIAIWKAEENYRMHPNYPVETFRDMKTIIERGYRMKVLSDSEAIQMLIQIGVPEEYADKIVTTIDIYNQFEYLERVIGEIEKGYLNNTISHNEVLLRFSQLNIPGSLQNRLLSEWEYIKGIGNRPLTTSQYLSAVYDEIIDTDELRQFLKGLGYSDSMAWILTKLKNEKLAPDERPPDWPIS